MNRTVVHLVMLLVVLPPAFARTIYVDGLNGNDAWSGACEVWDGVTCGPKRTVQAGINLAAIGDVVQVAEGTYRGSGNRQLNLRGLAYTLRGAGADRCIVDAELQTALVTTFGTGSRVTVEGFTFANGFLATGGALSAPDGPPTLRDCVIRGCRGSGGLNMGGTGVAIVERCTFENNETTNAGGAIRMSNSAQIVDCTFRNNRAIGTTATHYAGAVFVAQNGQPSFTRCLFQDNYSFEYAGAVSIAASANPTFDNCEFTGNRARFDGGAVYLFHQAQPTFRNCLFTHNACIGSGGAIFASGSTSLRGLRMVNCALSDNSAGLRGATQPALGGAMCAGGNRHIIENTIIYGNSATAGPEVAILSGETVVDHCIIRGGQASIYVHPNSTLTWGIGNSDAEPQWTFGPQNFRLRPGSPCIDAGTNAPQVTAPVADWDGNTRPLDGDDNGAAVADIGPFEFSPTHSSIAVATEVLEYFVPLGSLEQFESVDLLRNAGGPVLNWTLESSSEFLVVTPASGSTFDELATVQLHLLTGTLPHGDHGVQLTLRAPAAIVPVYSIQVVIHVNDDLNVPAEYPTIQSAIDTAVDGDTITLADGTYSGSGNRNLSVGSKRLSIRSANGPSTCIIDCQNQGYGFDLTATEPVHPVTFEGLTIRRAAGAIRSQGAWINIAECRFESCSTSTGAGIYCREGRAFVTESAFQQNDSAGIGGGLSAVNSEISIQGCTFDFNSGSDGGAIALERTAGSISACAFHSCTGNEAAALLIDGCTNLTVSGSDFSGNSPSPSAYAVSVIAGGSPELRDCTVMSNSNGLYFRGGGSVIVRNCVVSDNQHVGVLCGPDSNAAFLDCEFDHNERGFEANSAARPMLVSCVARQNRVVGLNFFGLTSPTIIDVSVTGTVEPNGDGLYLATGGDVFLANSEFAENAGHGVRNTGGCRLTAVNCIFRNNQFTGIYSSLSNGWLLSNCVFFGNLGAGNPTEQVALLDSSTYTVANSIVWRGSGPPGNEIRLSPFGTTEITHCIVRGGFPGPGNIDADPRFVDAAGHDFRLTPDSPAIDAGTNFSAPADIADLDNDRDTAEPTPLDAGFGARFFDDPETADTGHGVAPIIDIGAFELRPCPADLSQDGVVSLQDLAILLSNFGSSEATRLQGDLNGDQAVGLEDLALLLGSFGGTCP